MMSSTYEWFDVYVHVPATHSFMFFLHSYDSQRAVWKLTGLLRTVIQSNLPHKVVATIKMEDRRTAL